MTSSPLHILEQEVSSRTGQMLAAEPAWPCHKGCDDCCRHLAAVPSITAAEWKSLYAALQALPAQLAAEISTRIHESATVRERPVVCPILNRQSGACHLYHSRPVACRAYGFYAEREKVLGCSRIEAMSESNPRVVWGNHMALEDKLHQLGPSLPLFHWLALEQTCQPSS